MICATCRAESPAAATTCSSCGALLSPPASRLGGEEPTILPRPAESAREQAGDTGSGWEAPTGFSGAPAPADGGPLLPGQKFGERYRIIKLIGSGGMGAVYQAWDSELAVVVALKVIRPEIALDPTAARELERRFKRELLLARRVTHKNVVRIHDLGELDGVKYITMPFVEGADLATLLAREDRLPVARALRIARAVASGLAAAHQAGVVHRDLKPANIMIGADDEALIMDFGIARSTSDASPLPSASGSTAVSSAATSGATAAGEVVGTIEYMAPEQARGEPADERADIYAFGLIVYDMLVGRRRHAHAPSAIAELRGRLVAPPPAPRTIDPRIPLPLDRLVTRCIAPALEARYQKTADLLADLDGLDDEGRPLPSARRVAHGVVAASLGLVAAMALLTWWLRPPTPATAHAAVPIVIADFENRTGDHVFDGTLEPALAVAMEGASFITAFDRLQARAEAARLKPGSRLDTAMARLVAVREGIRVVLAGGVSRRSDGFAITLTALEASSGRQLWGAREDITTKDRALGAVGALAANLRTALGDTASAAVRFAPAETFTTASLESMGDYARAQELATSGRNEEAIALYRAAVTRDPRFGRAHSGWATSAFQLGRRDEAAAEWKKALALMEGMTEREKYRTLGTYYLGVGRIYEKAIENYETLLRLYPADLVGMNNLAYAYFSVLDFARAQQVGERAFRLYPKNTVIGNNDALYAMYAGDFQSAAARARGLVAAQPSYFKNYLPLAVAAIAENRPEEARDAYTRMAGTGRSGDSLAAIGLADLDIYQGRFLDAERRLNAAIAADEAGKQAEAAAVKLVALAEVYENTGRGPAAVKAAGAALRMGHDVATLVPAARVLIRQKDLAGARRVAAELGGQLEPQSRAFGKIVEGDLAAEAGRYADAIDAYRAAVKLADFWLARFSMGIAYVRAGHEAEALPELDACRRRRGEASALFLDDTPSFRILATLPYWLGRAQEGVGQGAAARANYQAFLALRGSIPRDPFVRDAEQRLRQP